ncbi:hypothetical protein MTO96_014981 [Rhipicephalus appendiculatus]
MMRKRCERRATSQGSFRMYGLLSRYGYGDRGCDVAQRREMSAGCAYNEPGYRILPSDGGRGRDGEEIRCDGGSGSGGGGAIPNRATMGHPPPPGPQAATGNKQRRWKGEGLGCRWLLPS